MIDQCELEKTLSDLVCCSETHLSLSKHATLLVALKSTSSFLKRSMRMEMKSSILMVYPEEICEEPSKPMFTQQWILVLTMNKY